MKGKEYELMVKRFNDRFMKDYFVYHQSDVPYFAMDTRKTRPFKPEHLPDYIYLHKTKPQYAIEIKYCSNDRFSFDRVKDKQRKILEKFNLKVGTSFVLIGFKGGTNNHIFCYNNFMKMLKIKNSEGKKSFNSVRDKLFLKRYSTAINRALISKNYYLDLSLILVSEH